MPAAQPDQFLMQVVGAAGRTAPGHPAAAGTGTHLLVAAWAVLLDAEETLLITGVDRRRAPTVIRIATACG